jgi:hypothetical protein
MLGATRSPYPDSWIAGISVLSRNSWNCSSESHTVITRQPPSMGLAM